MFNKGCSARFRAVLGFLLCGWKSRLSYQLQRVSRLHNLDLGATMESSLGLGLFLEELLQDSDDAAGFRQVAVLRPGVLQQHISISAALQELAAAKQGVMTHLCLTHEAL